MDTAPREWRQVAEFPEYEVSRDGLLRSWKRKARRWRNPAPGRRSEPIIVTGYTDARGYRSHILYKPGDRKPYRRMIHKLVALAFLDPPYEEQTDVCHNDGDPSNNSADNLRWDTHRANQLDMRRHGTMQDGERCITAKLTDEQAAFIRTEARNGPRGTQLRLARQFNISKAQVCRIAKGHRWAGV